MPVLILNFKTIVALILTVVMLTACGGGASPNPITLPVSNAGATKNVTAGTQVTLDGSASTGANTVALHYIWAIKSKPDGSQAVLTNATSATPTFTADVAGVYVITLIVNDGSVDSGEATVTINAAVGNSAPDSNAGKPQTVAIGTVVRLDGSSSTDVNNDPLSYSWTLTTQPPNSKAILTAPTSVAPTFTADLAGIYIATLVVNDGQANSSAATVPITANNPPIVSIDSPLADTWARKTITVTGTIASAVALTKVELLVNDASIANATNLTAPSFQLDTTTAPYPDGPYRIALRATDVLGQVTTTPVVLIKVDNTPPTSTGTTTAYQGFYIPPGSPQILIVGLSGVAVDNYSGVVSAENNYSSSHFYDLTSHFVVPLTDGSWGFPDIGYYNGFATQTTRISDAAGNCTDYKVPTIVETVFTQTCSFTCTYVATNYNRPGTFALSVSGACP